MARGSASLVLATPTLFELSQLPSLEAALHEIESELIVFGLDNGNAVNVMSPRELDAVLRLQGLLDTLIRRSHFWMATPGEIDEAATFKRAVEAFIATIPWHVSAEDEVVAYAVAVYATDRKTFDLNDVHRFVMHKLPERDATGRPSFLTVHLVAASCRDGTTPSEALAVILAKLEADGKISSSVSRYQATPEAVQRKTKPGTDARAAYDFAAKAVKAGW